jgi:hypothetical protein
MFGEALFILILVFVAGLFMSGMLLTVWTFKAIRGSVRLLTGACKGRDQFGGIVKGRCGRQGCGVVNPPGARFCRRCGRALSVDRSAVPMRRAAMW